MPQNRTASEQKLGKPLKRAFFARSVHDVAPDLIGATLLMNGVGGTIVEVEAYHHTDPAAHSFHGPTPRNRDPLVRQFRLREGGFRQRRADPRAAADPWHCCHAPPARNA